MPEKKPLQNKFLVVMIFAATLLACAIAKLADRYPEFPNPQDTVEHNFYHFNIINIDNTVLTVAQIENLASSMAKVWQLNYPEKF
jgi:hypothetical protein